MAVSSTCNNIHAYEEKAVTILLTPDRTCSAAEENCSSQLEKLRHALWIEEEEGLTWACSYYLPITENLSTFPVEKMTMVRLEEIPWRGNGLFSCALCLVGVSP